MRRVISTLAVLFIVLLLLFPALNHASSRVAFMGDSLTQGWAFPRKNLGIHGQTTAQMLERFPRQVSAGAVGEVVIVGGTNDVLLGIDPTITLTNLSRMIDLSRATGIRPVLAKIPPIYQERGRFLPAVCALDAGIAQLAEAKGVSVVDFYSALSGHPADFSDGIHLKRRGYLRMEWELLKTDHRIAVNASP